MFKLAAAVVTAAAMLAVPAAQSRPAGTISQCASLKGHVYEACFAYVVNDSLLALRNYYRLANSNDPYDSLGAGEDFQYRFRGAAYRLIQQRVAGWPAGTNTVYLPRITIISARASLATNTAHLTTRETWRVTTSSGRVLFAENNKLHHITMARVRGKLLHIWVVTAIR